MAVPHEIRGKDGGTVPVVLTRSRAIKAFCTECLGHETHPRACTDTLCPLYPFRGQIFLARGPRTPKKGVESDPSCVSGGISTTDTPQPRDAS